jgi:hypothetical protein
MMLIGDEPQSYPSYRDIANRETGVAIAKMSTYHTGQNFPQGLPDLAWVIEQVRSY